MAIQERVDKGGCLSIGVRPPYPTPCYQPGSQAAHDPLCLSPLPPPCAEKKAMFCISWRGPNMGALWGLAVQPSMQVRGTRAVHGHLLPPCTPELGSQRACLPLHSIIHHCIQRPRSQQDTAQKQSGACPAARMACPWPLTPDCCCQGPPPTCEEQQGCGPCSAGLRPWPPLLPHPHLLLPLSALDVVSTILELALPLPCPGLCLLFPFQPCTPPSFLHNLPSPILMPTPILL